MQSACCKRGSANTDPPHTRAHRCVLAAVVPLLTRPTMQTGLLRMCNRLPGRNIVIRKDARLGVWGLRLQLPRGINKRNNSNITASDANIVPGALDPLSLHSQDDFSLDIILP